MKRLFIFGCSFTEYNWPTWADIISTDLGLPFQNWGHAGIGNVGIFNKIVEADLRNKFTDQDIILVLWSHWYREDRYVKEMWQAHGNVFNNDFYDQRFISKYWSLSNDIIKNSTSIIAANKAYKINFQGHIIDPASFEGDPKIFSDKDTQLLNFYKPNIPTGNVFPNFKSEYDWAIKDGHPDILTHLSYVRDTVYPSIGLTLKDSTIERCNSLHKEILSILTPKSTKNDISEYLYKTHKIQSRKYGF